MNLLKKFLIMLVCCFTVMTVAADDNKGDNTSPSDLKNVILQPVKVPSKRPTAPSRVYIECMYSDGYMEFVLPEGIDSIQVTLTDGDFELIDFATIGNPVITLPSLSGVYDLICITPDGREFGAEIVF